MIEDLEGREPQDFEPIHILNLEVKDNAEEAEVGAIIALELCQLLQKNAKQLEDEIPKIVDQVEGKYGRGIMNKTCYL